MKAFSFSYLQNVGFIVIALVCSRCSVYHTNLADVPLISQKNDLRLDGGISFISPAASATVSYGVTNKIAAQAYAKTGQGYYVQGALGYFKNMGNRTIMEVYNGFGYGYGSAYNDANPGHLSGNYQTYFSQFNLGRINGKFSHLDYGFGLKAGYLRSSFTDNNYYQRYSPQPDAYVTYRDNSLLIEPTAFVRMGGEKLKFSIKVGGSQIYKFTNTDKYLPYSQVNFGFGINYLFSTKH